MYETTKRKFVAGVKWEKTPWQMTNKEGQMSDRKGDPTAGREDLMGQY